MSTYTQPFFSLLLLITTASVLFKSGKRYSRAVTVCAVCLFLIAWRPTAWLASQVLERGYSEEIPSGSGVQAIVVLSSSVLPAAPPRDEPILGSDTYERCRYAAWLYAHGTHVPVLASGGSRPESPYARVMRRALEQMGVPPSEIWTEETSHSTYQSAVLSSEMLRAKGVNKILLVTEAYHMPRAERSFRKQGLDVVPASCGFRHPLQGGWLEFLPDWQAISWNEDNLHEIGGLAWYRISGRI